MYELTPKGAASSRFIPCLWNRFTTKVPINDKEIRACHHFIRRFSESTRYLILSDMHHLAESLSLLIQTEPRYMSLDAARDVIGNMDQLPDNSL